MPAQPTFRASSGPMAYGTAPEGNDPVVAVKTEVGKLFNDIVYLRKILVLFALIDRDEAGLNVPYDELLLKSVVIVTAYLSVGYYRDLDLLTCEIFVVVLLKDKSGYELFGNTASGKAVIAAVAIKSVQAFKAPFACKINLYINTKVIK